MTPSLNPSGPDKAELLRLLLLATQDGIVDHDLISGEVSYNARWRHLLGFDDHHPEARLDAPDAWQALMHPDDRANTLRLLDDHLQQGWPLHTTVRMQHRHGGYRHVLVRGAAQRDAAQNPQRLVLVFSDIDEHIRREQRQRALSSALPDTLVHVKSDGTILNLKRGVDHEGSPFAKLREGLLLGDSIVDARQRARLLAALAEPRQTSQEAQTLRVISTLADGTPLHHEIRIVRSGEDELFCIVRDVTEQRALEDHLLQSQKLGAIGQLAAGVAHEINTPMQFIGDNLHFAKSSVADLFTLIGLLRGALEEATQAPLPPERLSQLAQSEADLDFEYVRKGLPTAIERSLTGVERVTKIVGAMKSFAHPDTDQLSPTDLKGLIESTVTVATNEWKYVAEVDLQLDSELPPVPCIGGELNQVVLNLIVNASHAIADVVGSSGEKGKISISTESDEQHAVIRIADTGTGIPEHARAKVFEPFFTTKEVGKGTGQGLAMAYNTIVKRHRGSIEFETELGVGTTFVIKLPLTEPAGRSAGLT